MRAVIFQWVGVHLNLFINETSIICIQNMLVFQLLLCCFCTWYIGRVDMHVWHVYVIGKASIHSAMQRNFPEFIKTTNIILSLSCTQIIAHLANGIATSLLHTSFWWIQYCITQTLKGRASLTPFLSHCTILSHLSGCLGFTIQSLPKETLFKKKIKISNLWPDSGKWWIICWTVLPLLAQTYFTMSLWGEWTITVFIHFNLCLLSLKVQNSRQLLMDLIIMPLYCTLNKFLYCLWTRQNAQMSRVSISHFGRLGNLNLMGSNPNWIKPMI